MAGHPALFKICRGYRRVRASRLVVWMRTRRRRAGRVRGGPMERYAEAPPGTHGARSGRGGLGSGLGRVTGLSSVGQSERLLECDSPGARPKLVRGANSLKHKGPLRELPSRIEIEMSGFLSLGPKSTLNANLTALRGEFLADASLALIYQSSYPQLG